MRFLCTLLIIGLLVQDISAQVASVEFGKNRIQYREFVWSQYKSERFIIYWYQEGMSLGHFTALIAENDLDDIQSMMEYRLNVPAEILVFNDLDDLKQSNIGDEEIVSGSKGITKISGNKIFVYFNGSHRELRKQIRQGIALLMLERMMFGWSIQEMMQNSVAVDLPDWFYYGLGSYAGEWWNTDLDDRMRDYFLHNEADFFDFAREEPVLAGHSMWYYIYQNYGANAPANLLYLTRINRSVEASFMYVLGTTQATVAENWKHFYSKYYANDAESLGTTAVSGVSAPQKDIHIENPETASIIPLRNRRNHPVTDIALHPSGQKLAYVVNDRSRVRVMITDIQKDERPVRAFRQGYRNRVQETDYGYPIITWTPDGKALSIIYKHRDKIMHSFYDVETGKTTTTEIPGRYDRILSASYITPERMVFTAVSLGISDVFMYNVQTRGTERITNDFYDYRDAQQVRLQPGVQGIVFASNRTGTRLTTERLDTTLPTGNYNLFLLSPGRTELLQLTHDDYTDNYGVQPWQGRYFSYLSDRNGVVNRYVARIDTVVLYEEQVLITDTGREIVIPPDSVFTDTTVVIDTVFIRPVKGPKAFSFPVSHGLNNIRIHHVEQDAGKLVQMQLINGKHVVSMASADTVLLDTLPLSRSMSRAGNWINRAARADRLKPGDPPPTKEAEDKAVDVLPETARPETDIEVIPDTGRININNYFFQSDFQRDRRREAATITFDQSGRPSLTSPSAGRSPATVEQRPLHHFNRNRIVPYRLTFKNEYFSTRLDNSLLFDGLESFAADGRQFGYQPPGLLMEAKVKDIFEDYEFTLGMRVSTSLTGLEYFFIADRLKQRLNRRFAFYRHTRRFDLGFGIVQLPGGGVSWSPIRRLRTNLAMLELRYPLDVYTSLRARSFARFDQNYLMVRDDGSLNEPVIKQQRVGGRLEYVYDNTLKMDLNLLDGTRYKVFAEIQKAFNLDLDDRFSLDLEQGFMGLLGLDFRHYLKITNHTILAGRLAAQTSFGTGKYLYFLGGTDNWIFQSFEGDVPIPREGDFAFQTVATNLRGFRNNVRNGNTFALANIELRAAIFNYFGRTPPRSSFLRHFQVVGFYDIGTAWQGFNPFDEDNPLNTEIVSTSPEVVVQVRYFRNPIVSGTGFGVRSEIFGYFLRLDYAWGIETGQIQRPLLYVSMGKDF